jgi:hypothetical protein
VPEHLQFTLRRAASCQRTLTVSYFDQSFALVVNCQIDNTRSSTEAGKQVRQGDPQSAPIRVCVKKGQGSVTETALWVLRSN